MSLPPLRDTMDAPTEPVIAADTVIRLGPITVTIAEIRIPAAMVQWLANLVMARL